MDEEYHLEDLATGMKILGVYPLLLKSLNQNAMLILDEPEVHLHPEWQVVLAEILTVISKELGTKMLISTHSAFFLEAIHKFGEKYKLNNNYYICEAGKIEEETDSIGKVYDRLNGNAYYMIDNILGESEDE